MGHPHYLPRPADPTSGGAVTVPAAIAAFCLLAFWLNMAHGAFRILPYGLPLLALIGMLAAGRMTLPPHAAPYLVLIVGGLAYAPVMPLVGWQDLYLMLVGLTPFMFGHRYRITLLQAIVATAAATVIQLAFGKGAGGEVVFDPTTSRSTFESTTSFVFGLLSVWAALSRRWGTALLALVLCVLTLKRIVVLAAVVTLLMLLPPRRWIDLLLRPLPMLVLNALFIYLVIRYTQGDFDRLIAELTRQSANQLGMGRQALYQPAVNWLLSHPAESLLHGVGPGGAYGLLQSGWAFFGKPNLHSDVLKVLVEYGGIVWVAFIAAMYWHADLRVRFVMLFVNLVFLTDNSLIYGYVTFTIGLAVTHLIDDGNARAASSGAPSAAGPPPVGPAARGPVYRSWR